MSKGKHDGSSTKIFSNNKVTNKNSKKIIKYLIIFIFICLVVGFLIYFFMHSSNKTTVQAQDYISSKVDVSKHITGLDEIEIANVNIQSSDNISIIEIQLNNVSNKVISARTAHFYLLDANGNMIFGTSLKLPKMEPNLKTSLSVVCSDNIENVIDYEIALD